MADEKIIDFIKTSSSKLEAVQGAYPYSFIHTHDENEENGTADDNLYIGEDKITDKFNLGETVLSGSTRKVGGLDVTTFGALKNRSISEILIDILTPDPSVSSVELDNNSVTLRVGQSVPLTARVSPENAGDKTVVWSSSNSTVASVNNGVVTALKVGTATITANASGKTDTCIITVEPTPVSGITLNKSNVSIKKTDPLTLIATVTPSDATDKTVTWSSSNTAIATVNNTGKITVTATQPGSTIITATAGEKSATCIVNVIATKPTITNQPSVTITYSGNTNIDDGSLLPAQNQIRTNIGYGKWSDGTTVYSGEPANITLTITPGDWGEPCVGGQTYTITGRVTFGLGNIPKDNFGNDCTELQRQGDIINSNTITIKGLDVIYINGYKTSTGDDGDDITVRRKYTFEHLSGSSVEVTIPIETTQSRFRIYVSGELSSTPVVKQYDDFSMDTDKYQIPIPMVFVQGAEPYYEREEDYVNTAPTKYKINF